MRRVSNQIFDVLEVYLPILIFVLLVVTVAVQVFCRYVLNYPLPSFFELSIYSFVWVIYLGASLAKRYRKHIRFNILYNRFPRKAQLFIDIIFDILTTAIFLIILIPSIEYTVWNYRIKASALRIPWTYLLVCFPLFVVLIIIHNCTWIYKNVRELSGKKDTHEETLPWQ